MEKLQTSDRRVWVVAMEESSMDSADRTLGRMVARREEEEEEETEFVSTPGARWSSDLREVQGKELGPAGIRH